MTDRRARSEPDGLGVFSDLDVLDDLVPAAPRMSDVPDVQLPVPAPAGIPSFDVESSLRHDLEAAGRLIDGDVARSTRATYDRCWDQWVKWCAGHGLETFPAPPAAVAAFLAGLHERGLAARTIDLYAAAIHHFHAREGMVSPIDDPSIRRLRRGVRRSRPEEKTGAPRPRRGRGPRKAITAVMEDGRPGDLQRLVQAIPPTLNGYRDKAIILLMFAGALRRSEVVDLRLEDLAMERGHLVLTLPYSKGDQEGHGTTVVVPPARDAACCPVAAVTAWVRLAGLVDGYLFRRFRKGRRNEGSRVTEEKLTGHTVAEIIKRWGGAAGLDRASISGHSLRRGFITSAVAKDADLWHLREHVRHRDIRTTQKYVEIRDAVKKAPGRDVL